jgi:hypothetical protein
MDVFSAYPDEARDMRVLHYLRVGEFNKAELGFVAPSTVAGFLARPALNEINQIFASRLRSIHGIVLGDPVVPRRSA